jgi:hypothetical protein
VFMPTERFQLPAPLPNTSTPAPSLDAPPIVAALFAGIGAAVVPWGLAACQVILQRGFEAGDLAPFAFWCAFFGVGTFGVSWALLVLTPGLGLRARHVIGVVAGLLGAFGFTALVAAILGPWIGAFGFPILLYWAIGGVAGQCLAVRMTEDMS